MSDGSPTLPPVLTAAFASVVVVAMAWLSSDGATGPDGAAYLRMAQHLSVGGGIDDLPAATSTGVARFAVWPPGYPLLLAPLIALGVPAWWAARLVGVGCLFATAALLDRWLPQRAGLAMLLLLSGSGLRTFAHTASEGPFVVAMLALAASLSAWQQQRRGAWVAVAASCAALFSLRYVGLFALPVVGLAAVLVQAPLRRRVLLVLATVPTALGAVTWLWTNQLRTGELTGMPRIPAPESPTTLLVSLARAGVAEVVHPIALISGAPAHALAAVVSVAAMAWIARRVSADRPAWGEGRADALLPAVVGGTYLLALVALRFRSHFDLFGWRLLYPGSALLLVGGLAAMGPGWRARLARPIAALAALSMAVQLGLAGVDGLQRGTWDQTVSATLDRYDDLHAGCVVGPHDTHLPFLRPDLRTAVVRFRPYFAAAESVDAFRARIARAPGSCHAVDVRHGLPTDRYDPSWAALAETHDDATLLLQP
jgi:hypothetical protein